VQYFDMPKQEKRLLLDGVEDVVPTLQYNHLYFAVSMRVKNWQTILADINQALAEFDRSGETYRFENAGSDCSSIFLHPYFSKPGG